ncbi:MAG TPA: hypothetical protein VHL09_08540, partial [Dehalococcoidia bacterium]|nr:hypothetical protein [Dehalococcoidia bacterium]
MPRKRQKKPTPARPAVRRTAPPAEIEHLLDEFESQTLEGDATAALAGLDTLYASRRSLPDIVAGRLVGGRTKLPEYELQLLAAATGAQAPRYLRRIAADRQAPDATRLEAQRLVGWPERGAVKRRVSFLASLANPEAALLEAINRAFLAYAWPAEALAEVLDHLVALPPDRRLAIIRTAIERRLTGTALLLKALLHVDDPAVQRTALSGLVEYRLPWSAAAVERLTTITPNDILRAEARRARDQILSSALGAPQADAIDLPPVDRVLLSVVDSAGGQLLLILRSQGPEVYQLTNLFLDDVTGIRDVHGATGVAASQADDIAAVFAAQGVDLVEVDLAVARGAVQSALGVNAEAGRLPPPAFELWEPLLHESLPPEAAEAVTVPELDDAAAGRARPGRHRHRLVDHPFFATWLPDMDRLDAVFDEVPPPPASGRLTERQYRPLIDAWLDPPTRELVRRRLRRQAWLLDRGGESGLRDEALAIAAGLPAADVRDPALKQRIGSLYRAGAEELFSTGYGLNPTGTPEQQAQGERLVA